MAYYRVPVFISKQNTRHKSRAQFKARIVAWGIPPDRKIDPNVLPRGCVWVEVEAADHVAAREALLAAVLPGDPRPIRSIHFIRHFRRKEAVRGQC